MIEAHMTWRKRVSFGLIAAVALCFIGFIIVTAVRHVLSQFQRSVSKDEKGLPTHSSVEARQRGTLVVRLACSPNSFVVDGKSIVINDCWIEQASEPVPEYVWLERYDKLNYYWINFKLSDGAELFADPERLVFQFEKRPYSDPPTNDLRGSPPSLFSAMTREVPGLPLEIILIDRKQREVAGRMILEAD